MIDGVDSHKDPIGIILNDEFVCGECQKTMVETAPKKYRCPKCGAEFENGRRKLKWQNQNKKNNITHH